MTSNHHRHSIRLPGFDYSQPGLYFVTLVSCQRENIFGRIIEDEMEINETGQIVKEEWLRSPGVRRELDLDDFVIMPNHIHGLVAIREYAREASEVECEFLGQARGQGAPLRKPKSIGSFVAGYKAITTTRINRLSNTPGRSIWQRNYYEHVVRNELEANRLRQYIRENPIRWALDDLYRE